MPTRSFCGLDAESVDALLAGPDVNICDQCIGVAVRTVATRDALERPALIPSDGNDPRTRLCFAKWSQRPSSWTRPGIEPPVSGPFYEWVVALLKQSITHRLSDRIHLVDPGRVVSCARSLKRFIEVLS